MSIHNTMMLTSHFAEKLEYTTKQREADQSELKLEQRQTSLLKAEMNTLK